MTYIKPHIHLLLAVLVLFSQAYFVLDARATLNARTVRVLKDHEVCVKDSTGTTTSLDLSTLISNSDSVDGRASSSGSYCPVPPLFTGGAKVTTALGISVQGQPVVQGLGRGILISEQSGDSGGVSSSGKPTDFNDLAVSFGGLTNLFFEVSLPAGCDVIDDDNDIVGSESDLSLINDISFPTCAATGGVTVVCNAATNELSASNGLVETSSGTPAKIRFVLSAVGSVSDVNMIDSILLRLDSQDIFCPKDIAGPLTATVTVNKGMTFSSPTSTQTIGTVDLGTPTSALSIGYAEETVMSSKGEISNNKLDTTAVLAPGSLVTANAIEIKELDNESIPIGINSAAISGPGISSAIMIEEAHLLLIPSEVNLFDDINIMSSNISLSDSSLIVSGEPVVVMTTADHSSAPFGSVVIKLKQNVSSLDPATVKTTITVNDLKLRGLSSTSAMDSTISLSLFEPNSGAIINTPGVLSIFDSMDAVNPINYSAFSPNSTRATKQNAVIGGAVNEQVGADRIQIDTDLSRLASRNAELGAPQITEFTKVALNVTDVNKDQITTSVNGAVITAVGNAEATRGGAKVTLTTSLDSVTVTSLKNGSFTAKLQGDFSKGDVSLTIKQAISGTESNGVIKTVTKPASGALSCEQTVCGCENIGCTPQITDVLTFVSNNGGLSEVVSSGGELLAELISSIKKALGLT
ncbi:MAG: hypothetical protein HYR97_02345 [Candidatus Melainabacteria bacterium]|nr:hypothetical protein [Candidatus Melainabacteria bacterium]